jgi:integrase
MKGGRAVKYFTHEQAALFFSVITDPRDRALFATIYHYGLRVSEATLLRLEDVDLERRRIFIHRLKGGQSGERPLFANTAQVLRNYLAVRPRGLALFTGRQGNLKRQRIQQLFRRYASQVGLESFTVHALRHSIATHLLEAGFDLAVIREHLGHASLSSTLIYAKITDRRREEIYRQGV